jgi:hypothetical protein
VSMKVLCLPLIACTCFAEQPPKDVEGWRTAKWGMTAGEILNAFPGEAKETPPAKDRHGKIVGTGRIEIGGLSVNEVKMSARFEFSRDTGGLTRIMLTPTGMELMLGDLFYKAMLPLLMEKYGQPTVKSEPQRGPNGAVTSESSIWSFPSTTIELVWYREGLSRIEYRKGGSKNNLGVL